MFFSSEDAARVASRIEFNHPDEPYGAFNNDAPYGIIMEQVTWPTVTHYMLGKQFPSALAHGLRQSATPDEARQIAHAHSEFVRNKWDVVKDQYVYWALLAKFTQHLDLEEMLINTGDAAIVYANHFDSYYGIGPDGKGHNMLGRLLMKVRHNLPGRLSQQMVHRDDLKYIEYLETALGVNSENVNLMSSLATSYLAVKWYDRARSLARRLIVLDPESEAGYYVLGLSLFHQGQLVDAVESLKRLTQLDATCSEYFRLLSEAYRRLDREIPATLYARRARLLDEG